MPGRSAFISRAFAVLLASLESQAADYFPLDAGNVWVYKSEERFAQPVTVEVGSPQSFRNFVYYPVTGFHEGQQWLRNDGLGRVYRFNTVSGREELWYDFTRVQGEGYESMLRGRVEVADTAGSRRVALGEFERSFYSVRYAGGEEHFLPYIGLVNRAGALDLVYARLSGVTVLNASGIGFGVAVSPGVARLIVNNNTGQPLPVVFSSGQTYDVTVRDGPGKVLYRWSEGPGLRWRCAT